MIRADELRVDWFRLLNDLKRQGISLYAVAEQIGVPRTTIIYWKGGGEPKHSEGERLVEFWCQVTGMQRKGAPKISRYDWRA